MSEGKSETRQTLDRLLAELYEPSSPVKDLTVKYEGTQIILPEINGKPMSFDEAIKWLERKKKEEEVKVSVYYEVKADPLDGAVAFKRAIEDIYGWSNGVPTPGFFGDRPPVMIGVNISATEKVNVPWGRIEIPGIDGYLTTSMKEDPFPCFIVSGEVKKKHSDNVRKLVELAQDYARTKSIYKGKAVKVSFEWMREGDDYDPMDNCPQFMSLNGMEENDLIFGKDTMAALNIGLFAPIEQSESCRKYNIPLKRGILLHGPYGTGKTLTAYVSALKAEKNGWTFVYLDSVSDLREGLQFAAQYAPAIVFAEDIDRLVNGSRSMEMDDVLNTLDGVDTKGKEIITVLTTNHIENINPAMLRPGRLDTLVEVSPPDSEAAQKLVSLYSRGLLAEGVSLERIGQALSGKIPAVIREVTERAKIMAIYREGGGSIEGKVIEQDIVDAALAMENHNNLLAPREGEMEQAASVVISFDKASKKYSAKESGNVSIKR